MPIDIPKIRKRCANAIKNTATGRYLEQALDELQGMREREETIRVGRCVSSSLIEIAMEQRDPAKWAALMLSKPNSTLMTVGDAMDFVEGTLRHALALMLDAERRECDRRRAEIGEAFVEDMAADSVSVPSA